MLTRREKEVGGSTRLSNVLTARLQEICKVLHHNIGAQQSAGGKGTSGCGAGRGKVGLTLRSELGMNIEHGCFHVQQPLYCRHVFW